MQRAGSSTERTPLVAPTYVFESSISRQYQKKLRNFQCIICVSLIAILAVGLLVTVGYNLTDDDDDVTNDTTVLPIPIVTSPPASLNLSDSSPDLQPLLTLSWPLKEKPPSSWAGDPLTPALVANAVAHGKDALNNLTALERQRRPLEKDTPASRAQRAAATAVKVKPLADAAYATEHATRALLEGKDTSTREGGAGKGPLTNGSFLEPPYCQNVTTVCAPSKYRTADGSCNNLEDPLRIGVSNTPFRRVLPADYGDGISSPRLGVNGTALPSARDVSVTVHRPSYAHDTEFTVMLAVWGQFIDHDVTATALSKGENNTALSCCDPAQASHPACFPVTLDVEDPFYEKYNLTCMEFVRSAPAPTCRFGPREQLNQATAFLDASTVYGCDTEKTDRLRSSDSGLLRMLKVGARDLLPPSTDPNDSCNTVAMNSKGRYCFESGDDRANENLHLTTMHLLWARQHNRIAEQLKTLNPNWSDETVFQESRRIVGAQMQHITYAEFLPSILGTDVMWALNLTLLESGHSQVYNPKVDPSIANHFSAAAFRFAHTLLPGLIHSATFANGSINYIQLHEMLFNPYALYSDKGPKDAVNSAINTPVHNEGPHVTDELSNRLFERPVIANASLPVSKSGPCGLDLVSLNIQRGRDHGIPSYPAWREHCGLYRPKNFTDLEKIFDPLSITRICKIYKNVDDIDLYTGALAENPRGRLLGPTFTCLIADQFLRLKVGDRFWYETDDPTIAFTNAQLQEIRKTTLASVICANEGLLDQAQPRVMEAVSATNLLVPCEALLQPSLTPWRESPTP